jgi:oligosaccharide repeat unit polymerase
MPDIPSISWAALYWIDVIAIGHFLISYYRNCYRKGYRIDFWHAQLFLCCVLPNMLMLPFAASEVNAITLNTDLPGVVEAVPTVFLITLVGYVAILAGGGLWRLQAGLGVRKAAINLLDVVPGCSRMLMSSRNVLVFQSLLCVTLQASILGYYFSKSGFGFSLRTFTFENPGLRPIALFISNYSIVIASHCLSRYVDTKERILLRCTLLQTLGLAFFGSRGNLLNIFFPVLMCYLIMRRTSISLFRIARLSIVILVFAFYLGSLRAGEYDVGDFFDSLAFLLLFGDNFSDLRDFAWVYSKWDHVLWSGKTYLAGILSFVPRFLSPFRDTWGLGVATSTAVGLDPQVHPGLRPGVFGEGYFNFGIVGVIAVGLMVGIVVRRVDVDVKAALASSRRSMQTAVASTMTLGVVLTLAISSGFSGLYVLAGVYGFSWVCISVERMLLPSSFSPRKGRMTSSPQLAQ